MQERYRDDESLLLIRYASDYCSTIAPSLTLTLMQTHDDIAVH